MMHIFFSVVVFVFLGSCHCACPEDDVNLQSWSNPNSWTSNTVPQKNDNVTLSGNILLDTKVPELFSITITGKLILSPEVNHDIRVHYIWIQSGGELHIGSESCKFKGNAAITLLGEPDEKLNIKGFGEKFIGVDEGGTLEIHGLKTRTWTKLTQTAPKFDPKTGIRYQHKVAANIITTNGLYVYHFKKDGQNVASIHVKLQKGSQAKVNEEIAKIDTFINGIPNGDVVAMATQKEIVPDGFNLDNLKQIVDSLIGSGSKLDNIKLKAAYALLVIKGNTTTAKEDLQLLADGETNAEAYVDMILYDQKTEFVVTAYNDENEPKSFCDFIAFNTDFSKPIIKVHDDVSSWKNGDKIFITSTDFDMNQVEEFIRIPCDQCSSTEIRLNGPLQYTHFGEIYKKVDMRAEVGVMTHNILIQGEVSEGKDNGGHVKFLKKFKIVRVEGLELSNMGQPRILGRYPLHYHMCEDLLDTELYSHSSYLRFNSIHHCQFRCITIHGTQNSRLTGNVCYDTVGHGYFLEDGGEKHTHIKGNLGLIQKPWTEGTVLGVTGAIPSDDRPTTYWITTPLVEIENNVAAGANVGFWFVYPDVPNGPSASKNFMQPMEARHTKITKCTNIVSHSNTEFGLMVDNIVHPNLTVSQYNFYDAKQDPLNTSSASVAVYFDYYTGYKNIKQAVWMRGEMMAMRYCSISDNMIGVQVIRLDLQYQMIENCVILGESTNTGLDSEEVKLSNGTRLTWHRSSPRPDRFSYPRFGLIIHKGGNNLKNIYFDDFPPNAYYKSAAIGFHACTELKSCTRTPFKDIKFAFDDPKDGLRVYEGNKTVFGFCSNDGDVIHNFRDADKSVAGKICQIVRPMQFHTTDKCTIRKEWNMACCDHKYASIDYRYNGEEDLTMVRTDDPYASYTAGGSQAVYFLTIMGGTHDYLGYMNGPLNSKAIRIRGKAVTKTDTVRMGFCIPRDADLKMKFFIGDTLKTTTEVQTLQEVDDDTTGGKYYFDTKVGVVFFKFINEKDFAVGERNLCPGLQCVEYWIVIRSGDYNDYKCWARFKANTSYVKSSTGVPTTDTSTITANGGLQPDSTVGAGSTYPFS